jgi:putative transposase
MLERVFKEVKRRTRVTGVFLNETGAQTLAKEIVLRSSEKKWTPKPYLTMDALKRIENRCHIFRDVDFKEAASAV